MVFNKFHHYNVHEIVYNKFYIDNKLIFLTSSKSDERHTNSTEKQRKHSSSQTLFKQSKCTYEANWWNWIIVQIYLSLPVQHILGILWISNCVLFVINCLMWKNRLLQTLGSILIAVYWDHNIHISSGKIYTVNLYFMNVTGMNAIVSQNSIRFSLRQGKTSNPFCVLCQL